MNKVYSAAAAAALLFSLTGCSVLFDGSAHAGGSDAGGTDAGADAPRTDTPGLDASPDACICPGGDTCIDPTDCVVECDPECPFLCDGLGECFPECEEKCTPGGCSEDGVTCCDNDLDGFHARDNVLCPMFEPGDCDDNDPLQYPLSFPVCGNMSICASPGMPSPFGPTLFVETFAQFSPLRVGMFKDFDFVHLGPLDDSAAFGFFAGVTMDDRGILGAYSLAPVPTFARIPFALSSPVKAVELAFDPRPGGGLFIAAIHGGSSQAELFEIDFETAAITSVLLPDNGEGADLLDIQLRPTGPVLVWHSRELDVGTVYFEGEGVSANATREAGVYSRLWTDQPFAAARTGEDGRAVYFYDGASTWGPPSPPGPLAFASAGPNRPLFFTWTDASIVAVEGIYSPAPPRPEETFVFTPHTFPNEGIVANRLSAAYLPRLAAPEHVVLAHANDTDVGVAYYQPDTTSFLTRTSGDVFSLPLREGGSVGQILARALPFRRGKAELIGHDVAVSIASDAGMVELVGYRLCSAP